MVGLQLLEGDSRFADELVVSEFVLITHGDPEGGGTEEADEDGRVQLSFYTLPVTWKIKNTPSERTRLTKPLPGSKTTSRAPAEALDQNGCSSAVTEFISVFKKSSSATDRDEIITGFF